MNIKHLAMVSALVITMAAPAMAQSTSVSPSSSVSSQAPTPGINEIKDREKIQDARFKQGVADGTISSDQAAKDEAARQQYNASLKSEAQANGGHLTGKEWVGANQHLNQASRDLYRQKH